MTATRDHQHHWQTASEHTTSQGRLAYQSCPCGRWRILRLHTLATVVTGAR
jgi:hypothetical protein